MQTLYRLSHPERCTLLIHLPSSTVPLSFQIHFPFAQSSFPPSVGCAQDWIGLMCAGPTHSSLPHLRACRICVNAMSTSSLQPWLTAHKNKDTHVEGARKKSRLSKLPKVSVLTMRQGVVPLEVNYHRHLDVYSIWITIYSRNWVIYAVNYITNCIYISFTLLENRIKSSDFFCCFRSHKPCNS